MFISKIVAGALLLNTGRQRPYTPPLEGVADKQQSGEKWLCLQVCFVERLAIEHRSPATLHTPLEGVADNEVQPAQA